MAQNTQDLIHDDTERRKKACVGGIQLILVGRTQDNWQTMEDNHIL